MLPFVSNGLTQVLLRLPLALLALGSVASAQPAPRQLTFRTWYPGFLPGYWGRTTLTLALEGDRARLEALEERPAGGAARERFNEHRFDADPVKSATVEGAVRWRGSTFTVRLAGEHEAELVCTPAREQVHAAGATVTPPACSPCYERCREAPRWSPRQTRALPGYTCRWLTVAAPGGARAAGPFPWLRREPERLFFTAPPGVEHVVGDTDCPPEGLREVGPPPVDWSLFPEGSTALREVSGSVIAKGGPVTHRYTIHRAGLRFTVEVDGVRFHARGPREPARSEDGQHTLGWSCWQERALVHSVDLEFRLEPGADECSGQDERASSRASAQRTALRCRAVEDAAVSDETLLFVPGRIIERYEVSWDCTMRRAVRFIPGLDAPPLAP